MIELSIVIPCLNEAATLKTCIEKAKTCLEQNRIDGEIIVADNGSVDGSIEIATQLGTRVVHVGKKGYGHVLRGGIEAAQGRYVIMGDADDSYDFLSLLPFVEKLRVGYDLVMGNRFRGGIKKEAMPFLHRYLGNPVLSFIGRLFYGVGIGDFLCGLRGFSKEAYARMNLITGGMEFAAEMVVKASFMKMKLAEVPTTLSPDGRTGRPHLRTWRDGWRYLRFFLLYSPRWLFLYPGLLLILFGGAVSLILLRGSIPIGKAVLDYHSLLYASTMVMIGFQFIFFFMFTKVYAASTGFLPPSPIFNRLFHYFTLERGLITGLVGILFGIGMTLKAILIWSNTGFGHLSAAEVLRVVIPAVTTLTLGVQILLYSFFISILGMKK